MAGGHAESGSLALFVIAIGFVIDATAPIITLLLIFLPGLVLFVPDLIFGR